MKNLVYDYQVRRRKLEQDQKSTIKKQKYKNIISSNDELPKDYPKDWTMQDKIKYLQKKLPPDTRLAKLY